MSDFDTHVADILNLFNAEELEDVILAGHSYGGAVISAVADRIPDVSIRWVAPCLAGE